MDKQRPRGMAIAAGKSRSEKTPAEELSKEETRFAAAHDSGPIGGMCRMHAVIVLDLVKCGNEVGPGPSRNNRKSRVYLP